VYPRSRRLAVSSRGRRGGPRRKTLWATTGTNATVVASGAVSSVGLIAAQMQAGVGIIGGTVIRQHLVLSCASTTSDTAPGVTWGVIVWDTTLAKPDPSSDFDVPWLHWDFLTPGLSCGSLVVSTSILYGQKADIRAKRRLTQSNERLFFQLKNDGSANVTYSLTDRCLIALP
jgi:hypothetical protein